MSDILRVTKTPYVLCFERQAECEDRDALNSFLSCPVRCKAFLDSVFVNLTAKSIPIFVFVRQVLLAFKNLALPYEQHITSSRKEIMLFARCLNMYFPSTCGIVVNASHVELSTRALDSVSL